MSDLDNIIEYIRTAKQQGMTESQIRKALFDNGWQISDIEEAFKQEITGSINNIPVPPTPSLIGNIGQGQTVQSAAQVPVTQTIDHLPGVFELLRESFEIYKTKFWTIWGTMALPALISLAVAIILGIVLVSIGTFGSLKDFKTLPSTLNGGLSVGLIVGISLAVLILILLIIELQFWSQLAVRMVILRRAEKIGVKQAYKLTRNRIGAYAGILILSSLVIFGGFIMLVIPGIIFCVWLSQTTNLIVGDDVKGMRGLLRSREYVRGHWWGVVGRTLFIGAIPTIISWLLVSTTKNTQMAGLFEGIFSIFSILFAPLAIVYNFLIYEKLKALKPNLTDQNSGGAKPVFVIATILGLLSIFVLPVAVILATLNPGEQLKKAVDYNLRDQIMKNIPTITVPETDIPSEI